jgi:glutamate/tyrosine decarboxylase-like PLP-dependent enzyme
MQWTPEHSRRARGFATYAALRSLGKDGIANLVARCCDHARAILDGASALPNVRVVSYSPINQGLLRFFDSKPGATEADHDRRTEAIIAAINSSGEALFTATTWRQQRCMRVSVSSWLTTSDDVTRTVRAIAHACQSA